MLQKERSLAAASWSLFTAAAKRRGRATRPLSTLAKVSATLKARILPSQAPLCLRMAERRELSSTPVRRGRGFRLTMDTINPYVKNMEYAVRGKMPQEAAKIESAIKKVGPIWLASVRKVEREPIISLEVLISELLTYYHSPSPSVCTVLESLLMSNS